MTTTGVLTVDEQHVGECDKSRASHSPALLSAIANKLLDMAESAEELGVVLTNDPQLVSRHHVQLQRIDMLCQTLGQLADVLTADVPEVAVDQVRLHRLRAELLASSHAAAA